LSGGQAWPVGQRLVADRPPSPSFLPFPSTIYLFSSTTTPLGQSNGEMTTWADRCYTTKYDMVADGLMEHVSEGNLRGGGVKEANPTLLCNSGNVGRDG
jgi:hypothetical protein